MALTKTEQEELESTLEILGFREFISPAVYNQLMERFSKIGFEKGDSVLLQGRSGGAFFILLYGVISVWAEKDGGEKVQIADIRPVTYFGEIALLERSERIATLIAEDHVEVFVLGKKDFFELFYSIPQIRDKIERQALERKRETGLKVHTPEELETIEIEEELSRAQEVIVVDEFLEVDEQARKPGNRVSKGKQIHIKKPEIKGKHGGKKGHNKK